MDEKTIEAIKGSVQELAKYVGDNAPKVISEVAKVSAVADGITAGATLIGTGIFVYLTFKMLELCRKDDDWAPGVFFGVVFAVLFSVATVCNAINCIQWLVSPNGKFILILLNKASN